MKRILPFLAILVLISGCSGGKDAFSLANGVKTHYNEAVGLSLTARVVADYGDRLSEFTLRLAGDTVTILEPAEVAGVSAKVSDDGVTLIYSGAEVFSGNLTRSGLSPVSALPLMAETWKTCAVAAAWFEGNALILEHRVSESVTLRTSFDKNTLAPVSALLTEDGGRVLSAEFTHTEVENGSSEEDLG